ncbi:MAG: hypothetical protein J7L95_00520 [Prolixibacteraceae bacterium]|nr:hypothetical protein [Prolixibacteraceae bacterium]
MKYLNSKIIFLLLILAASVVPYWQSTKFGFVLDDTIVITQNKFVQQGTKGISKIFNNDSMTGFLGKQPNLLTGGRYRPLSLAIFAIDYEYFKLNPFYYHLQNIIFYLLSCLLLYVMLLRLFQFSGNNKQQLLPAVGLATLLFAIHPVHTEAVANVKGLDEILAFLLGTATFLFTLLYFDKKKIVYLLLAGIAFILSLLAKESTLPLVVAIPVALYFFREGSLKTVFRCFLLFLVPTAIYLYIRYNAMGFLLNNDVKTTGIMNNPYFDASALQKAGTILFTLILYLKLLFFPHPLTHDYYPFQIKYYELYHPVAIGSLMIVALLIWVAVKGIKSRSKPAYIIFFFFVTLSIVSNVVVNVGTFMNERFLFIPSIALSMLVIVSFQQVAQHKKWKPALLAVLLLMLVGFTLKTFLRIPDWRNEKTLNKAAVHVSKNSARANCFYAVSLYDVVRAEKDLAVKKQIIDEANRHIKRSLKIYPEYTDALKMKAGFAAEVYKIDKDTDKLLKAFAEILKVRHIAYVDEFLNWLEPRTDKNLMADFYFNAGYKIMAVGKHNYKFALNYLQKGIKLQPNNKKLLFGNCIVNYLVKNYKKCISFGNKYLSMYGTEAEILLYLGNAQINSGQNKQGLQNLNAAYKIKPELKTKK